MDRSDGAGSRKPNPPCQARSSAIPLTPDVKYCFEDEDVDKVVKNMGEIQVRRLPVVSRDKRLVGTISMGDIAISAGPGEAGQAEASIAQPGGEHSQTRG